MKGLKYWIRINEDPTLAHEWMSREIEEVFVPDLGLYINLEAVFFGEREDRVPEKFEEILMDASGCLALKDALAVFDQLKKRVRENTFGERSDED